MSAADLAKLVFLSAIWGGSFIFLRVAAPEAGPLLTATLRTTIAGASLVAFATITRVKMDWLANLKTFAVVGLFAVVIPFSCFAFAALHLPAAYSALLNSTAPLFGAMFAMIWLAERLTMQKLAGLLLGIAGVGILVGAGTISMAMTTLAAVGACLMAAAGYALSSIIVKKTGHPGGIHPIAMAAGSMAVGSVIMLPTLPFSLPSAMPSMAAVGCIVAMALLSSGLAQALFIPLIVKIGPTRAMSTSFLIPLFSMLWAFLFLHETIGISTIVGGAVVLVAMALVLTAPHGDRMGKSA